MTSPNDTSTSIQATGAAGVDAASQSKRRRLAWRSTLQAIGMLPILIIRFAVAARAWARAASVLLVLSMPVVAAFSYAVGPYDAQPWWEGVSGILVAGAALCLLASAVGRRTRPVEQDASLESAVLT